jgi:hypothetical protein
MWHVGGHSAKAVLHLASALGSEVLDVPDHEFLNLFHRLRRQEQQLTITYAWANPRMADPDPENEKIPF